ncbi:MAG: hypothetical protein HZB76_00445 [Chlamydiae bacterium]|nr:hypothetical protein [Chlamydiota bacterium]
MSLPSAVICFVACHGGPADHFATFAEELVQKGYKVQIYASGPAIKKFQDRKISVIQFNADNLSKEKEADLAQVAVNCIKASVVITDVGHIFDIALQEKLAMEAPKVRRLAYYDNPEVFVPGGYSNVAAEVMLRANGVLFANANLKESPIYQEPDTEITLPKENRVGLGYYPLAQAEKILSIRKEGHDGIRAEFLAKYGIKDKGKKLLVYFGGNNKAYFNEAFPAFLRFLSEAMECGADLSDMVIILQQHPGAMIENIDCQAIEAWLQKYGKKPNAPKIEVSKESSEYMLSAADGALYYQTSMGPLFALTGIPTVQIAHKTFRDVLVRSGIAPSVTNSTNFVEAIKNLKSEAVSEEKQKTIYKSLGIKEDWLEILENAITTKVGA